MQPESDTMTHEETISKSPLDKPLHQLTEDDISQLTREDCRRYLKEKGMRRPSWNKSQAIQQVISLKTLLETTPDSGAGTRKKLYIPRPDNPHTVPKGTSANTQVSVSVEEYVRNRRKDPGKLKLPDNSSGRFVAADNDSAPPRITDGTVGAVGQMTIFYCGKVNVYDDVPVDKARAIMHLAASPLLLPQETPCNGITAGQPLHSHFRASSVKVGPDSSAVLVPTLQTVKMSDSSRLQREESNIFREDSPVAEGPVRRKASVQRYLEKRKDRFKSKRKVGTPSSASLDIYLDHQMVRSPKEHSSRSETCSPPPIRAPNTPTQYGSLENNQVKDASLSAAPRDKDIQD